MMATEAAIAQAQELEEARERLLLEIQQLQLQQNQSLRALLLLRLEQFWIRHNQISSLLGIIEDFQQCSAIADPTYHQIRHSLMRMSLDILSTLQRLLQDAVTTSTLSSPIAPAPAPPTDHHSSTNTRTGLTAQLINRLPLLLAPPTTDPCAICLTPISPHEEIRLLPCMHYYHSHCVSRWLSIQPTCPACRCSVQQALEIGQEQADELLHSLLPAAVAGTGSLSSPARSDGGTTGARSPCATDQAFASRPDMVGLEGEAEDETAWTSGEGDDGSDELDFGARVFSLSGRQHQEWAYTPHHHESTSGSSSSSSSSSSRSSGASTSGQSSSIVESWGSSNPGRRPFPGLEERLGRLRLRGSRSSGRQERSEGRGERTG